MHAFANLLVSPPLWLALLFAAAFAGTARVFRWLTWGGAFAAFLVGFVVFGFGGGKFLVPLLTFFLTSSLLSHLGKKRKAQANSLAAKGSARDAGQVWANGGMAVALVLAFAYFGRRWPVYETRNLLMLYLAALATVNADTWSTELGVFSKSLPRLLSNWKPVPHGTSGAITLLGVLAAMAGSVAIPLSALWLWRLDSVEFIAVAWAGFLGSLTDSVLGAGAQIVYRDPLSGNLTERTEVGGRPTERVHGLHWINNDMVNFLASVIGVLCAWALLTVGAAPFR